MKLYVDEMGDVERIKKKKCALRSFVSVRMEELCFLDRILFLPLVNLLHLKTMKSLEKMILNVTSIYHT